MVLEESQHPGTCSNLLSRFETGSSVGHLERAGRVFNRSL